MDSLSNQPGLTLKLLRYSAGVSQSSERCSNVTVRVSPYSENKASSFCTSTFCTFPSTGAGFSSGGGAALMLRRAVFGSLVSHTCQRGLPFPGNSFSCSIWGTAQLEVVHLMLLGDDTERLSCSFLALPQHTRRRVLNKKHLHLLIHGNTWILFPADSSGCGTNNAVSWCSQSFPETW